MTVCERILDDLKAYLDGELRWGASITVRRHLASCAGCREELEAMRALQTRLRSADTGELPAALRARILAACSQAEPSGASLPPQRGWFARPQLAIGAVACAILFAAFSAPLLFDNQGRLTAPMAAKYEGPKSAASPSAGPTDSESSRMATDAPSTAASSKAGARNLASGPPMVAQPTRSRYVDSAEKPAATNAPILAPITPQNRDSRTKSLSYLESRDTDLGKQTLPGGSAGVRAPSLAAGAGLQPAPALSQSATPGEPKSDRLKEQVPAPAAAPAPGGMPGPAGQANLYALSLGRKAELDLTVMVDNVPEKAAAIAAVAQSAGGAVARDELHDAASRAENLTIDVPIAAYRQTIEQIKLQGDIISKPLPEAERLLNLSPAAGSEATSRAGGNRYVDGVVAEELHKKGSAQNQPLRGGKSDTLKGREEKTPATRTARETPLRSMKPAQSEPANQVQRQANRSFNAQQNQGGGQSGLGGGMGGGQGGPSGGQAFGGGGFGRGGQAGLAPNQQGQVPGSQGGRSQLGAQMDRRSNDGRNDKYAKDATSQRQEAGAKLKQGDAETQAGVRMRADQLNTNGFAFGGQFRRAQSNEGYVRLNVRLRQKPSKPTEAEAGRSKKP